MESTLLATATGLSKTLCYSTATARSHLALLHLRRATSGEIRRFGYAAPLIGGFPVVRYRLACVSSSSFASGGGGYGGGVFGGGGGGGGGGGDGEVKVNPIVVGADDASGVSSDVIVLDVGGMTCGGCSASVKRILESQPLVSAASVNLTTETAIVWPVPEAKGTPNWQKVLGEELAKHLTTCGFNSNLRGEAATKGEPSQLKICKGFLLEQP